MDSTERHPTHAPHTPADDDSLAICTPRASSAVVAWRKAGPVTFSSFLADAIALAERLPQRASVVNYCSDRYRFLVAFVAALLREQQTLLPNDQTPRALDWLAEQHAGLYALVDDRCEHVGDHHDIVRVDAEGSRDTAARALPAVPLDRVVAHVFTSGTTGRPSANAKTWRTLAGNATLCAQYMGIASNGTHSLVATVPPQHMYGLETSVLTALRYPVSIHAARPLLPEEVAAALAAVPAERTLITTPLHLRALAMARPKLPPLATVVSATAPLGRRLAADVERLYDTDVREIYGCSEAGTIATRRTVADTAWSTREDVRVRCANGEAFVEAPYLPAPVPLADVIESHSPRSFTLHGRASDMLNVAGKRASLSGLNTILCELDGVRDGAFYLPEDRDTARTVRLIAFVVAPERTEADIRRELRDHVDPAFLPRRIHRVERLPRTASGKLPREALDDLARRARGVQ